MPSEPRNTTGGQTSPDEVIDLLETIWLPLDPNQVAEWKLALTDLDLEVASEAILIHRDASNVRPSVQLFQATYRGLQATRPRGRRGYPGDAWFDEQRAKLRKPEASGESHPAK